jgi:hypothetical protein
MERAKRIKRGLVNWEERVYESSRVYCVHSWLQGSIYTHIPGLCKGEVALNLFNKLNLTTFKPAGRHRTVAITLIYQNCVPSISLVL